MDASEAERTYKPGREGCAGAELPPPAEGIAYSPTEALKIARANPGRKVVFLAIGFETTAPAHVIAAWQARREGLTNFSMLVSRGQAPPAILALMVSSSHRVQGCIAPGHVCTVMGRGEQESLVCDFHVPIVSRRSTPPAICHGTMTTRSEARAHFPRSLHSLTRP